MWIKAYFDFHEALIRLDDQSSLSLKKISHDSFLIMKISQKIITALFGVSVNLAGYDNIWGVNFLYENEGKHIPYNPRIKYRIVQEIESQILEATIVLLIHNQRKYIQDIPYLQNEVKAKVYTMWIKVWLGNQYMLLAVNSSLFSFLRTDPEKSMKWTSLMINAFFNKNVDEKDYQIFWGVTLCHDYDYHPEFIPALIKSLENQIFEAVEVLRVLK